MGEPRRQTHVRQARPGAATSGRAAAGRRHPADDLRLLIDRLDAVHAVWTGMPATHAAVERRRDEIRAVASELDALLRGPAQAVPVLWRSPDGTRIMV